MKSIYERIDAVVRENGCVPEGFVLEMAKKPSDIPTKYMGELEGIIGPPSDKADEEALAKAVKMLKDNIKINAKLAVHEFDEHDLGFSVAKLQGHLLKEIIDNVYDYDPHKLSTLAYSLVNFGTKLETVKLGLLVLVLFDFADDEIVKRHLITLGLYEEFTSYVISSAKSWPGENKNHVFYVYAQKLKGYGKINALHALEPVNEEVREWILCHGCENDISLSYLGKVAYDKSRLLTRLEEGGFNEEQMLGVRKIIRGLLDEEYAKGISLIKDPVKLAALYLKEVAKHSVTLEDVGNLYTFKDYLVNKDNKSDEAAKKVVVEQIDRILSLNNPKDKIKKAISTDLPLALSIAKVCGTDISEDILNLMRKDFNKYHDYIGYFIENNLRVDDALDLCKDNIIGRGFPEGMGDDVFSEDMPGVWDITKVVSMLDRYPGKGSSLVNACINSSIVSFRSCAADLLLKWENAERANIKKIDSEAFHSIKKLKKKEVNNELKAKWDEILEYK